MHERYSIQVSDGLPTGVTSFCTFSTTLHGHVSTVQTKTSSRDSRSHFLEVVASIVKVGERRSL